jgi:tetratricopeptide (TPR) repeat protein
MKLSRIFLMPSLSPPSKKIMRWTWAFCTCDNVLTPRLLPSSAAAAASIPDPLICCLAFRWRSYWAEEAWNLSRLAENCWPSMQTFLPAGCCWASLSIRRAILKKHPNPYLYYLRAAALLKLQSTDYDRISRDLAIANEAIPECTLCYLAQSKVHEARGDLQSAIADLEQAVKLDPNFEEAWYHLSRAYARVGRRDQATRASAEFSRLKSEKTNRDTEILRDMFLKTLAAQE